jgi:hypothetical protein
MRHFRFHSAYAPVTQRQFKAALDEFAELLSRDIPLPEIAERMTITGGTACVMLETIRERLGGQAV